MAAAKVTPVALTEAGAQNTTYGAAVASTDGVYFANTERSVILINNVAAGGTVTVTAVAKKTTVSLPGYGSAVATGNITLTVADGAQIVMQLPTARFNDAGGNAWLTFSEVTGVTIAVFDLMRGV